MGRGRDRAVPGVAVVALSGLLAGGASLGAGVAEAAPTPPPLRCDIGTTTYTQSLPPAPGHRLAKAPGDARTCVDAVSRDVLGIEDLEDYGLRGPSVPPATSTTTPKPAAPPVKRTVPPAKPTTSAAKPTTTTTATTLPAPASPVPASPAPASPTGTTTGTTPGTSTPTLPTEPTQESVTSPAPTSPAPTSPAPTSPAPTSPAPTSPAPTSPAPTSPVAGTGQPDGPAVAPGPSPEPQGAAPDDSGPVVPELAPRAPAAPGPAAAPAPAAPVVVPPAPAGGALPAIADAPVGDAVPLDSLLLAPVTPAALFEPLGVPGLASLPGETAPLHTLGGDVSAVTTSSEVQALGLDGLHRGGGLPAVLGVTILSGFAGFALRHRILARIRTATAGAAEPDDLDDDLDDHLGGRHSD